MEAANRDPLSGRPALIVEAVVFDLFHTLVDPEQFRPRSFSRIGTAGECFGVDPTEMERVWAEEVADLVLRSSVRTVDMLAEAAVRMGGSVTDSAVTEADEALGRYQDMALMRPLPGVVEILRQVRSTGIKVGLLSNAHERDIRVWDASPLAECFDAVVMSCDAGVAKPEPGSYAAIIDRLGVIAESAIYCGDGNGGELSGARDFGFGLVVAITGPALESGFRTPEEIGSISSDAHVATGTIRSLPGLLGLA
ncbi:HAD family hydrolase [bacterium]|nr:HAD family hydrolase [bacterium]